MTLLGLLGDVLSYGVIIPLHKLAGKAFSRNWVQRLRFRIFYGLAERATDFTERHVWRKQDRINLF